MKQKIIPSLFVLGMMLSTASFAFASTGAPAIISHNPPGTRELNPQPEPPGVTEQKKLQTDTKTLHLNPQPEPPGVVQNSISTSSTSTVECAKNAQDAKKTSIGLSKIEYSKAIQAANEAKKKAMAYAKTLTNKEPKKAAILKAHSDYTAAITKAREDKESALARANEVYKTALDACKSTH